MMFSDDIVQAIGSREEIEQDLERWRNSLERRGMKVSRIKTEYLCANEQEVRFPTVTIRGAEVPKLEKVKYFSFTVQAGGGCTREIRKRVKAGWTHGGKCRECYVAEEYQQERREKFITL